MTDHPYHHGDLPNALRRAAADLVTERGPAGFSLREVARRVGVSHAAPAHHFGDQQGLLTALAIEGFDHLRAEQVRACEGVRDPSERLIRQGVAYVTVVKAHPGHCAVMFRQDLIDVEDPAYGAAGLAAFGELVGTLEALAREQALDLDVAAAARWCWTMLQGLLDLEPNIRKIAELTGTTVPSSSEALAEEFVRLSLTGLLGHHR